MKNRLLLIAILLSTALAQSETVLVELKLQPNKVYKQSFEYQMVTTQTIFEQKTNMLSKAEGIASYQVQSELKDGYELKATFEKMLFAMQAQSGMMEFSSEKDSANDIISFILKQMIGKPFTVVINKNGKIASVVGFKENYDQIVKSYRDVSVKQKEYICNLISKSFGPEAIKGSFQLTTEQLPGKKVDVGSKWNSKQFLKSVMSTNAKTTAEVQSIADGKMTVKTEAVLVTADKKSDDNSFGATMQMDLTGQISSVLTFDLTSGWPIDAKINQKLTGSGFIEANEQLENGLTIPLTINTVFKWLK